MKAIWKPQNSTTSIRTKIIMQSSADATNCQTAKAPVRTCTPLRTNPACKNKWNAIRDVLIFVKKDATCKALDSFWQNCYCNFFLNLGSSFVRMTILIFLSDSLDHYILVVKKGASTRKCARRVLAASVATVPRSNLKNIKSSRIRVVKKGISSFRFYIIAVKGYFRKDIFRESEYPLFAKFWGNF